MNGRLLPTGHCWCGCESEAGIGSFFLPGHDRFAESAVIRLKHRDVAHFLVAEGFGPGGRNARKEFDSAFPSKVR